MAQTQAITIKVSATPQTEVSVPRSNPGSFQIDHHSQQEFSPSKALSKLQIEAKNDDSTMFGAFSAEEKIGESVAFDFGKGVGPESFPPKRGSAQFQDPV